MADDRDDPAKLIRDALGIESGDGANCVFPKISGASHLAFGIGLLTETALALGQTPSATLIAQVTGSTPPAGVLVAPPPAPVAVPSWSKARPCWGDPAILSPADL